jgi:hypothetical protein
MGEQVVSAGGQWYSLCGGKRSRCSAATHAACHIAAFCPEDFSRFVVKCIWRHPQILCHIVGLKLETELDQVYDFPGYELV